MRFRRLHKTANFRTAYAIGLGLGMPSMHLKCLGANGFRTGVYFNDMHFGIPSLYEVLADGSERILVGNVNWEFEGIFKGGKLADVTPRGLKSELVRLMISELDNRNRTFEDLLQAHREAMIAAGGYRDIVVDYH